VKIRLLAIICAMLLFGGIPTVFTQTKYRLPLASNPGYNAWFDHDSSTGKLRYDCVTSFEYDGHHGTDFNTPLGTSVYAGATGSFYQWQSNCPDGSLPDCGGSYGNNIKILHADGRVTIYAHLKQGTIIGPSSVTCGAYLAQSGNSGRSSGPHLHFELWQNTSIGTRLDFFSGSCNSPSYWVNQNGIWPTTQCQ